MSSKSVNEPSQSETLVLARCKGSGVVKGDASDLPFPRIVPSCSTGVQRVISVQKRVMFLSSLSIRFLGPVGLLICVTLACGGGRQAAGPAIPPTRMPLPTFTATSVPVLPPTPTLVPVPTDTPIPLAATETPAPTLTPILTEVPTDTPTAEPAPTMAPLPPTDTATPAPPNTPAVPPSAEPIIKYVIADAQREFNCDFTAIYGWVRDANNFGVSGVTVHALGIHESTGLEFITETDGEGHYEAFRIPLAELASAQWAVMLTEDGRELSERFHWTSTAVCQSDDTGHSQVLRVDWKLIE